MATEKLKGDQPMLPGIPEVNPAVNVDIASKFVREFIKGKRSVGEVGGSLKVLTPGQLEIVSVATRVPVSRLETLASMASG